MTDTEREAAIKKQLADQKSEREAARTKMAEDMANAKPTPTQDENDQAAMGLHTGEHEPDGSPEQGPDGKPMPKGQEHRTRQAEAAKPAQGRGDYSTRSSNPAPDKA
ncbi:hypothetical protein HU675_0021335 [Bradyrhizobium septentrionale]|uniref:hypothetical protein n=1 Tax=Bradyrhizobium septentrionale TaxID=1404411 RepID=UPI001596CD85|nr:hypothetical protein [Bradyrhizobium septentrionale]UGY29065.1 hypothetical protein HU675_0021335 [Bradyrhizobium septentrionale]